MTQNIKISTWNFQHLFYHMSRINWPKNFSRCSINGLVASSSMQKLWLPAVTVFVEKIRKKIGEGLDLYELPHGRNFGYLERNGVLKFFEQLFHPGPECISLGIMSTDCMPIFLIFLFPWGWNIMTLMSRHTLYTGMSVDFRVFLVNKFKIMIWEKWKLIC